MIECFYKKIHSLYSPLKFRQSILALLWTAGLISGTFIAASCGNLLFPLMRSASSCPVSIVGLLSVLTLPFLFTAAAVYFKKPVLILPLAFFKALNYGFCVTTAVRAFGSAGWIVRLFLLFSSSCTAPVLYWFWMRHISDSRRTLLRDFSFCMICVLAAVLMDYGKISPFLVRLIMN